MCRMYKCTIYALAVGVCNTLILVHRSLDCPDQRATNEDQPIQLDNTSYMYGGLCVNKLQTMRNYQPVSQPASA